MSANRTLPTGKVVRLRRLIDPDTGTCCVVALDHGMTSPRFLDGLAGAADVVDAVVAAGVSALMLGRGGASTYCTRFAGKVALALMLTASAAGRPSGPQVTPIGSVEEALRLGADCVVVYVALGGDNEPAMIRYLSDVGEACDRLGMPLIAEAEFPDAYSGQSLSPGSSSPDAEYLTRNARLCCELGADIVKVNWTGDERSFSRVVQACERPIILAGGPVLTDGELFARMEQARNAGAIGYSVGRNIFESRAPRAMTEALNAIFRAGAGATEAAGYLVDVALPRAQS